MKLTFSLLISITLTNFCFGQHQLVWEFQAKGGIYSSPVTDNNNIYIGSNDSIFYAINKVNGNQKWSYKTNGQIRSKASIYKKSVIFNSTDGKIYCLNKKTGKVEWIFNSSGEKQYDIWDYYLSSPIVKGDSLFIGSGDQNIYCINASNGTEIWKHKTQGGVHATAVLDQENLYIGSFDGYFYALNQKTGHEIWKFKTVGDMSFPKGEIQRSALLYKNAVIFGSRDYNIYAVNIKTGQGLWNMKEKGSWIIATPLMYNNSIYFGTSDSHKFYKMNADFGYIESEVPLNMRVYASAIEYQSDIIFPCFNGKLYKLSSNNSLVELFQTYDSKKNYSSIFNKEDHFVDGFQLYGDDYKEAEKKILGLGSILSTPSIDNNIIYFGDASGYLYALKLDSSPFK